MQQKFKQGISAAYIVGLVFTVFGLLYMAVGGIVWYFAKMMILLIVFGVLGLVFAVIGLGILIPQMIKRRSAKRAYESGIYVNAVITAIEPDRSVQLAGRHPYYALCEYKDPKTHDVNVFRSADKQYIPAELVGTQVRVYRDPYGNGYYVDIDSSLPDIKMY